MKQTIKLSKGLLLVALFGAMLFTSCKKDNASLSSDATTAEAAVAATSNTVEASKQDAQTEAEFDDIFNITGSMNASTVGEDLGLGTNVSGLDDLGARVDSNAHCFHVSVVPNIPGVFPKVVTINFGDGCLGRDGKFRKGKIVSVYTNRMLVPGAKVSTTFVNYYVDSFKIEGTHISENTSTSNMQGWKLTVLDGKRINTNTNKWVKRNSTKNILQITGNGTPNFPLDDVYKITGGGFGSNSAGHTWTTLIDEPLIKKFTCNYIVKGTVQITRDGNAALLDYGNGECDNQAILYINGVPHIITL
jgi:hypothetical protein